MSDNQKPLARRAGLAVAPLRDETVVYDLQTDKAHCLNPTAAHVWKQCDGENAPAEIARLVERDLGAAVPVDVVSLALSDLARAGLLEPSMGPRAKGPSRREVMRRTAGMAMVALPLISTLLAPSAASAASACACVNPGDCLSQTSCPSTVNCNGSGICAP